MNTDSNMIDYLDSRDFLLDTLVHREGDFFVYLEPIPEDKRMNMEWRNTHLFNCKCLVKHVGTREQIADLIADRLHITKIDQEATKNGDGDVYYTTEYSELDYILSDLPEVVNSIEEA